MIALNDMEKEYLKKLLRDQSDWWVRDSLVKKIKCDDEEKDNRKLCKHEFGKYEGHKTCCTRCGGFGVGHGESWSLAEHEGVT